MGAAFARRLIFLIAAGLAQVAVADPVPEPEGLWTGPMESDVPATISGGRVIRARELAELLAREPVVVVDVSNAPKRPEGMSPDAPWLPLPHEAIPGSLWIPDVGLAAIPEDTERFYRQRLARATGGDLDHPIVVYCHARCWLSWNAARRAIGYGFRRVHWMPDGIEGWRAAGLPTAVVEPEKPASAGSD